MNMGAVLGINPEPRLRALYGVSFVSTWAFSAFWGFVGVWAVHELDAPAPLVGVMYALDAAASALLAVLGGRLSDRVGRRRVIALAWAWEAAASWGIVMAPHRVMLDLTLVVMAGAASGPGSAGTAALVADLTRRDNRDSQYAALRASSNLGAAAGPPVGGWVIGGGHWSLFFGMVGVLGLAAAALAAAALPRSSVDRAVRTSSPPKAVRTVAHNRPFMLLLGSTLAGFWGFVGYDVMLPIVAIGRYGLNPSAWGVMALVNPAMIVVMQGRVSRRTASWPPGRSLAVGSALMGFSFGVLVAIHSMEAVWVMLGLFGVGEMVWSPTTQVLGSHLADPDSHGLYLGALGAVGSLAWVLAPLSDLSLYTIRGPGAVWVLSAMAAGVAAALGLAAARGPRTS